MGSHAQSSPAQDTADLALRDALAYAESIVATVREPLLVLDGQLRVVTASRAFYRIFGGSGTGTQGEYFHELGNGQWNIPALRTLLEAVLPQETSFDDFEVVHVFPALGRRVMLLNARKLWREGNHTERILLAFEDVTERHRIAEELLRSNEDLLSFAHVAAHDLRSPLSSAINLAQLLEKRLQDRLNEDEAQILTLALENMQRMSTLMQDILTYSMVANADRQAELVSMQDALQTALANLQHLREETGAEIISDIPAAMRVNGSGMVLILQNLIGNALKYRREERPRILISAVRERLHWRLSVTDNGQGFAAEYAEQIFEPFKRLHGPEVTGSGIGLSTCKRIVERLHGRIWAESESGKGSTFYVTLPFE